MSGGIFVTGGNRQSVVVGSDQGATASGDLGQETEPIGDVSQVGNCDGVVDAAGRG